MLIKHLAIIGVGLIGGSLASALRKAKQVGKVTGFGRDINNLKKAVELGIIDEYTLTINHAVENADVIVLATPLSTTAKLLSGMRDHLTANAIITDVGSAKGSVVEAARQALGDKISRFVPGHPIAGREKSGVDAATADLFQSHRVILTPCPETSVSAISTITEMWEHTGAEIAQLGVEQHDEILAATSHLPHMLAYALVDCLAGMQEREDIFKFAAGGFADFTRIASSHPQMWTDICFSNREKLLVALETFDEYLNKIRSAINNDNNEELLKIFSRAKETRDRFTEMRNLRKNNPE